MFCHGNMKEYETCNLFSCEEKSCVPVCNAIGPELTVFQRMLAVFTISGGTVGIIFVCLGD